MTCLESTTILTLKTFKSFVPIQLFIQFLCQTKVVQLSNFFVRQKSSSCPISLSDKSRPVVQFLPYFCKKKYILYSLWIYMGEQFENTKGVNRSQIDERQKTKGQTIFLFYFLCDVYIRNVWRSLRVIKSGKSKERQCNDQKKKNNGPQLHATQQTKD